ncbi:unnamed protein product [Lathyrus sativus]|nr:unnamed protein product [Lathyrus sativus]
MVPSSTERKSPNMNSEEDDSRSTLHCNLIPVMLCIWNSLISIHKFAGKHFNLPTAKRASTNPNIIMESLPSLPFDLVTEILSRLPVKMLVRFRCVCKPWNSLISDHDFSRKHFKLSTTRNLYFTSYSGRSRRFVLKSYPLQSVFTDLTTSFTRLEFPFNCPYSYGHNLHYIVGSCDGILCLAYIRTSFVVLWNPSIRKFKELPLFENPEDLPAIRLVVKYGFGYDHVSRNYKVVVLYNCGIHEGTTKIKVYTLSTNSWRNIGTLPFPFVYRHFDTLPFPFVYRHLDDACGIYVSGSINWLAYTKWHHPFCIVSFDLGTESCQRICPPGGLEMQWLRLCVLKDCLCVVSRDDVWVMKEYGVKESWTKLFELSNSLVQFVPFYILTNELYIFEDDKVWLEEKWKKKLIKNDTFKVTAKTLPQICTESLISPCS